MPNFSRSVGGTKGFCYNKTSMFTYDKHHEKRSLSPVRFSGKVF